MASNDSHLTALLAIITSRNVQSTICNIVKLGFVLFYSTFAKCLPSVYEIVISRQPSSVAFSCLQLTEKACIPGENLYYRSTRVVLQILYRGKHKLTDTTQSVEIDSFESIF